MKPRSATLLDVAREAGVSRATVARVLSAGGYVGEETRLRVEEAVRLTGYRPNVMARSLRTQRTYTIGHITAEFTQNPFFAHVARSIEREGLAHGYKTFLYNQDGSDAHERAGVEQFIERRVDAVIFTYPRDPQSLAMLRAAAMPVVQIERDLTADTDAVLVDNYAGAAAGMAHLLQLGHRRIAFIGGDPDLHPRSSRRPRSVEEERLDAYRDALAGVGASIDEKLIWLGRYYEPDNGINIAGYRAMKALLELPERPTAIFTGCDVLAAGALQALYEANLRIPDDMSVVGFDDTTARILAPRLTSVAQPMTELGKTALQLALTQIDNSGVEPQTIILSPHLIVRNSTAPLRG
ncbi:LacI family DNA-binding transcriptional regulator [Kaistia adipata]|uniref:LacI family DNA-binding transcriptional regulator n=1 Tax=Kaistia adipata TaxID=166954 RepID=UPI000402B9CE|nr:LacI family DNA-binding transcriptional regulator [Kaistia adipata]